MPLLNGTSACSSDFPLLPTGHRVSNENGETALRAAQRRTCELCKFREGCLGRSLPDERQIATPLITYRRRVNRGEVLYRSGTKCEAVYTIRAGFFKTMMLSEDGIGQITGFQMPGDLLGIDCIGCGKNRCDAIALSQSEVCAIPCGNLLRSSRDSEALQAHVLRALCDDIGGNHGVMLLLGNRSAEERVVAFVINLSERYLALGSPWSEFQLWMTREEIGSFLGLKLETVSRIFSKLDEQGLIAVRGRHIQIRDFDALQKLIGGADHHADGRRSRGRASFRSPPVESKIESADHEPCAALRPAKRVIEHAAAMGDDISTPSQTSV